MAATAWRRGIRYSDWSSAPLLGMKPMRKWGSRSHHGPGTPSWAVQLTGSSSMIGCRSTVAAAAPNSSSRSGSGSPVTRRLTQTWSTASPQRVNTLTLSPAAVISSKCSCRASHASALEHPLADLVGRLDVQGDAGDRTEGAEPDDQAVELGVAPGDR